MSNNNCGVFCFRGGEVFWCLHGVGMDPAWHSAQFVLRVQVGSVGDVGEDISAEI